MSFLFSRIDIIYFYHNPCFFHIPESMVDGCSKRTHGGTEVHIGIHQGRHEFSMLPHFVCHYFIIFFKRGGIESVLQDLQGRFGHQWELWRKQMLIIGKELLKKNLTSGFSMIIAPSPSQRLSSEYIPLLRFTVGWYSGCTNERPSSME